MKIHCSQFINYDSITWGTIDCSKCLQQILAWKVSTACLSKSLTSNNSPVDYVLLYLNLTKNGDVPAQNE